MLLPNRAFSSSKEDFKANVATDAKAIDALRSEVEKQEFEGKMDAYNERAMPTVTSPKLSSERDEVGLMMEGVMKLITGYARQDIRSVWTGLRSYGFDLHREHVLPAESSHLQGPSSSWTNKQDEALMKPANNIASKSNILPLKNCPNEIYLTKAELASEEFKLLQGISIEDLRTRFAILCSLTSGIEKFLIPLTDLRSAGVHPNNH